MAEEEKNGSAVGAQAGASYWAKNVASAQESNALIERALEAASPNAVFQEPVVIGDTAVITCTELSVGVGVGYGGGGDENSQAGGGGGGGGSMGRPVAVISIRPDGVKVEPIVDVTKLGIAALSTLIALILARGEVKRTLAGR